MFHLGLDGSAQFHAFLFHLLFVGGQNFPALRKSDDRSDDSGRSGEHARDIGDRGAAHRHDDGDDPAGRRHAHGQPQPRRGFAKHPSQLFLDSLARHAFHEGELNRLQKFPALAGKIRNGFLHARFPFGSQLRLDRVLQLRPKPAQIGLE